MKRLARRLRCWLHGHAWVPRNEFGWYCVRCRDWRDGDVTEEGSEQ